MSRRRSFLLALAVAALALAGPIAALAPAKRRAAPRVPVRAGLALGIADQRPNLFTDPRFRALGIHLARLAVPYDAYLRGGAVRRDVSAWLTAARRAGVQPLISFEASAVRPHHLPSVREYVLAVRAFRRANPWVRTFSTWNEGNHALQPTYRHPQAAGRFYLALRRLCRGCTVLAAEPMDGPNLTRWIRAFQRVVHGPQLWALHNYEDTNPRPGDARNGTARFLKLVRGRVWLTETGGIVFFKKYGKVKRAFNPWAAYRALRSVFRLAVANRRIQRVYVYDWQGTPGATWDSAMIGPDNRPRPMLAILRQEASALARIARRAASRRR